MSFKISRYLNAIAISTGSISAMIGILVLIGWIFNISVLKSLNPDFISMKANTAICFIFLGISIVLLSNSLSSVFLRNIARILVIFVLLISTVNLFEYILNWNAGIDEILFKDIQNTAQTIYPGRMAGNTVICFILLCISLLITDSKIEWLSTIAQFLALTTALISILPQFGYAYKDAELFTFVFQTPMALHTAIAFLTISIGIFFLRPAKGILKILSSEGTGGFLARRLFPVIVLIPILFIWFRLAIQVGHSFKTLELGLISLLYIVIYVVTLWRIVVSLNRMDLKQKQIEADLIKGEKKYRNIFENIQDVFYQVDKNELITEISPSIFRMAGYRREELIGKSVTQFYHDLNDRVELIEQISKKGEVWDFEAPLRTKCGQIKYTSFNAHLLYDSDGKNIGIEGTLRDIDERKQSEIQLKKAKEKAEESDLLKSAFLNNISHEIRTPLNAITGFSALLSLEENDPDSQSMYIETILKSSDHLLSIVSDIIDISSIQAGATNIQISKVNLNKRFTSLFRQFLPQASGKNISLFNETGLQSERSDIMTDPSKLERIFSNLISNAIKFTARGKVTFGYSVKDSFVEFFVSDTGIGIPVELHSKIFENFYQVEKSLSRQYEGTGLGLSICKAFTEYLGGKIWLQSEPGNGSIFFFTLPYVQPEPDLESLTLISESVRSSSQNQKTILVAEDDDNNFLLIKAFLSNLNSNVIHAINGIKAVEVCRTEKNIDLILMDINMPEMDGYKAVRQIREFLPDIKIIAQTAFTDDRMAAMKSGCSDFISKPFTREQLISKVNENLSSS